MKKSYLGLISLIALANLFAFSLAPVLAADDFRTDIGKQLEPVGSVYGYDNTTVDNTTLARTVASIIKIVLGFLGVLFLVLILYAGFIWMTAAGNDESIAKAKKIMTAAIIGVTIILAAYAITFFVIDNLVMALSNNSTGIN